MRCLLLVLAMALLAGPLLAADAEKPINFEEHIAGILKQHCRQCHGEGKQESGLNFASYAGLMKGGSGGEVVVAGRSSASRLVEVITAEEEGERMPPDNDPVPPEQVAMIKKWIDTGLRENAGSSVAAMRTLGFTPTAVASHDGPAPMPADLPAVERPQLRRPFPVLALAASPRADLTAVASYELVDLMATPEQSLGAIGFPEGEPHVLRFSPSGGRLLVAGGRPVQTGVAAIFDVVTGNRLATVGDEPDAVIAADISPDERRVALGGSGRVVKVFSTEDGSLLHTLTKHTDWVTAIAYSPDGKLLVTGDRIGNIHLWDAESGGVVLPLAEHKGSIRALSWRSDSGVVASCGEDGLVVWWDVKDGWPVASKPNAHPPKRPKGVYGTVPNGVLDAAFGPAGELATCGRDGKIKLWSAKGKEEKSFAIPDDAPAGVTVVPTRVAISFDGKAVLAGDSAGRLHTWPTR